MSRHEPSSLSPPRRSGAAHGIESVIATDDGSPIHKPPKPLFEYTKLSDFEKKTIGPEALAKYKWKKIHWWEELDDVTTRIMSICLAIFCILGLFTMVGLLGVILIKAVMEL